MKKRANAGETLTETLCAVLVTGVGVALLASMISASSRMQRNYQQKYAALTDAVAAAETASTPTVGTASITVQLGGKTATIPVSLYGNKDWVLSYSYEKETTP